MTRLLLLEDECGAYGIGVNSPELRDFALLLAIEHEGHRVQQGCGLLPVSSAARLADEFHRDGSGGPILQIHNLELQDNQVVGFFFYAQRGRQLRRLGATEQHQQQDERELSQAGLLRIASNNGIAASCVAAAKITADAIDLS